MGDEMVSKPSIALISALIVALPAGAALAATRAPAPVPKPKPTAAARVDPQAAIARLVATPEPMGTTVSAYAPAATPELSPANAQEVALYLVGKLTASGGPIGDGLVWRVFREFPGADGQLPLVKKARGGDLDLRLKPGRYIVHVAYGRATLSRTIDLRKPVNSETFVLNAGGLQLDAVLDDAAAPIGNVEFELYAMEGGTKRRVGNVKGGAIARLPAGAYHIVSKYGGVNAIRSADVTVEAGKLTHVSLRHQAGTVRLKLVRDAGGEAIADTSWTVYGPDGRAIYQRVGAHANVTLAAGEYAVVAKHRDTEFTRSFTVSSGKDDDVVVVARRL
jgi:hypothetical protein